MKPDRSSYLLGSTVFHGGLIALVVFGAAFVKNPRPRETPPENIITFVPDVLTDRDVAPGGGGSPQKPAAFIAPTPAQPAAQAEPPVPQPPKTAEPPVKPPEPKPKAVETKPPVPKPPKATKPVEPEKPADTGTKVSPKLKPKPEVNLKPVMRQPNADDLRKRREREEAAAEAQVAVERQRFANARRDKINGVANGLARAAAPGVSIQAPSVGPGGGGPSYANYDSYVQSLYQRGWNPPVEVTEDASVVQARVVIGRDGRIVSSEIVEKSGIATLDRSVRLLLDRITTIGKPFPDEAKETTRSYLINFNLKARRSLG